MSMHFWSVFSCDSRRDSYTVLDFPCDVLRDLIFRDCMTFHMMPMRRKKQGNRTEQQRKSHHRWNENRTRNCHRNQMENSNEEIAREPRNTTEIRIATAMRSHAKPNHMKPRNPWTLRGQPNANRIGNKMGIARETTKKMQNNHTGIARKSHRKSRHNHAPMHRNQSETSSKIAWKTRWKCHLVSEKIA